MHHRKRHFSDIKDFFTHRGKESYANILDFGKAYYRVYWTYVFEKLRGKKIASTGMRLLTPTRSRTG